MDEALDDLLDFSTALATVCVAHHVGLEEQPIVEDRAGDVGLGREMDDIVGFDNQRVDELGIVDVAVPEPHAGMVDLPHLLGQIVGRASIGERIEYHDAVVGIFLGDVVDEVAADEPGAPGDQHCRHHSRPDYPSTDGRQFARNGLPPQA